MQSDKYESITLALAGILQAASLVNQLAMTGRCEEDAFYSSITSLYKIDAEDVPSIYGGKNKLLLGLKELENIFSRNKEKSNHLVSRYALSLILLQQKLIKNKIMLDEIKKRINQVLNQVRYFSETHDTVIANLSDIYLKTISTFNFRIQIVGKPSYLHNEIQINKIRALFLAGIRSAVLWQQMGGSRWQLFFRRPTILKSAKTIIARI